MLASSCVSRSYLCLVLLLLVWTRPVAADLINLNDGRAFEGTVVHEDATVVKFDTQIGRMRALLSFDRTEIKSLERKELPANFFEPPPAPVRKGFKPGQVPYLEVPIVGDVGDEVVAGGVGAALRYARRNSIEHVVFTIDSTGGTIDEALHVYDRMKDNKGKVNLHAIVKNSVGPALAVTAWCDTIHVQKGARVGGRNQVDGKLPKEYEGEEPGVVRAQLADKVARETGGSPQRAAVLKAMINPDQSLYAWKANGAVKVSPRKPADASQLIVAAEKGQALQLSYEQCVQLGVPELKGDAEALGELFRIKGWVSAGDYGKTVMKRRATDRRKRAKAKASKFERHAERNIKRREETQEYIDQSLRKAMAWDPTAASYETYQRHFHWGWGIMRDVDTKILTDESQREWLTRTDGCAHFLKEATRGLVAMKSLDKRAVTLGLEPTYAEGEIDGMLADIQKRLADLIAHRNKERSDQ